MGGSADKRFNMSFIVENGQKAGTPFIAISLNYRLNGWGFLNSNEIRGEGATNLGLRDQRLALHWVSFARLRNDYGDSPNVGNYLDTRKCEVIRRRPSQSYDLGPKLWWQ